MKDRAFVIGNGPSRRGLDLDTLLGELTIGCNAIVRDWSPNIVVALDEEMIGEIANNALLHIHRRKPYLFVPNWQSQFEFDHWHATGRWPNEKGIIPPRSNAGVIASTVAIVGHGAKFIYFLGMDSLLETENCMDNIYAGTHGYTRRGPLQLANDAKGRAQYVKWYIKQFNDPENRIFFTFVFRDAGKNLREGIDKLANVSMISFKQLKDLVKDA